VIEASSEEAGKKVIERMRRLIRGQKVGVDKKEGAKEGGLILTLQMSRLIHLRSQYLAD
jgi:hypothetical protein